MSGLRQLFLWSGPKKNKKMEATWPQHVHIHCLIRAFGGVHTGKQHNTMPVPAVACRSAGAPPHPPWTSSPGQRSRHAMLRTDLPLHQPCAPGAVPALSLPPLSPSARAVEALDQHRSLPPTAPKALRRASARHQPPQNPRLCPPQTSGGGDPCGRRPAGGGCPSPGDGRGLNSHAP